MIYHITHLADWEAIGKGFYCPSSLATEGFIHCSSHGQLLETAKRYYAGANDLVVLHIEPSRTKAELVWENTVGGSEDFPHLYGPLEHDAVVALERLVWTGESFVRQSFA